MGKGQAGAGRDATMRRCDDGVRSAQHASTHLVPPARRELGADGRGDDLAQVLAVVDVDGAADPRAHLQRLL